MFGVWCPEEEEEDDDDDMEEEESHQTRKKRIEGWGLVCVCVCALLCCVAASREAIFFYLDVKLQTKFNHKGAVRRSCGHFLQQANPPEYIKLLRFI